MKENYLEIGETIEIERGKTGGEGMNGEVRRAAKSQRQATVVKLKQLKYGGQDSR